MYRLRSSQWIVYKWKATQLKLLGLLLGLVILVVGCSGDQDSVSESGSTEQQDTSTSESSKTNEGPATSTSESSKTNEGSDTSKPTASGPRELAADCLFDEAVPKISCRATGTTQDSKLRWESNVSGWVTGSVYEFELKEHYQLVPEARITLEQCVSSGCEEIVVTIDTSAIVGNKPIDSPASNNNNRPSINADSDPADIVRNRWHADCFGEGSSMMPISPIAPEDLDFVKPLGALSGVHITPVSHQYYYPKQNVIADVKSPIDGTIIYLTNRGTANSANTFGGATGQSYEVQYVIEYSCDYYLVLDHVIGVPEKIKTVLGDSWDKRVRIPVKTGELLGKHSDGAKVDFSVIDLTRDVVTGLVNPKAYYGGSDGQSGEPFKLFERDSFEYYEEPLRSAMEDKSLRTISPRGGIFGYDIEGTLQGNWYVDGTSYEGREGIKDSFGSYFKTHAALVPNHLDKSMLRIGIGDDFRDKELGVIYGVALPAPSFDSVTTESGLVMYEIRELTPCDGSDPTTAKGRSKNEWCNKDFAAGTVLLELIDSETMKLEAFFDTPISSDLAFTSKARLYSR